MTKSIKLEECIVTPVDDDGMSQNWLQLVAVEESDHAYFWIVGMEDDRRVSLQYDREEPSALMQAYSAYLDRVASIRQIAAANEIRNEPRP